MATRRKTKNIKSKSKSEPSKQNEEVIDLRDFLERAKTTSLHQFRHEGQFEDLPELIQDAKQAHKTQKQIKEVKKSAKDEQSFNKLLTLLETYPKQEQSKQRSFLSIFKQRKLPQTNEPSLENLNDRLGTIEKLFHDEIESIKKGLTSTAENRVTQLVEEHESKIREKETEFGLFRDELVGILDDKINAEDFEIERKLKGIRSELSLISEQMRHFEKDVGREVREKIVRLTGDIKEDHKKVLSKLPEFDSIKKEVLQIKELSKVYSNIFDNFSHRVEDIEKQQLQFKNNLEMMQDAIKEFREDIQKRLTDFGIAEENIKTAQIKALSDIERKKEEIHDMLNNTQNSFYQVMQHFDQRISAFEQRLASLGPQINSHISTFLDQQRNKVEESKRELLARVQTLEENLHFIMLHINTQARRMQEV